MAARSREAEVAWMAEREAMRGKLEAAEAGRAEAGAVAKGAEAKYEQLMQEGTERQVAERMAVLETRSTALRVKSETLQQERDAAVSEAEGRLNPNPNPNPNPNQVSEAEGLRAELDMVSGLRRREKSELTSRLASLEEHVVKMHAASWSLQKTKLLQLQKAEASQDQLRARHAAAKPPWPTSPPPCTNPSPRHSPAMLPCVSGCCARRSYTCVPACYCPAGTPGTT